MTPEATDNMAGSSPAQRSYHNNVYGPYPSEPGPSTYQSRIVNTIDYSNQIPHDSLRSPVTNVESIPAPRPKVAYEAPVFRTFQERRRAKEMAMSGGVASGFSSPPRTELPSISTAPIGDGKRSFLPNSPASAGSYSGTTFQPPAILPPYQIPHSMTAETPHRSSRPLPRPLPSKPVEATIERSDTLSSVKSLDRTGFSSGRRPLPKAPVGVNSSRSLDRGIPGKTAGRKQPSVVLEENESERSTSPLPIIVTPPAIREPSGSPAKFEPLPSFNFPDSDEESSAVETGVAFSGLPVISVSSEVNKPAALNQSNGAIVCAKCQQPVVGRIVNAMGQRWHPHCFTCNECGGLLEHVSSYEWEGKAYCHLDYHDKFAYQCFQCKTPIVDSRFVTLNDPDLGERYYHELHFFCSECGDPFLDPSKSSSAGTEKTRQDDEGETNPFVIQKGHPYCEKCHLRLHKPKCKKCSKPIPDIAVNAMGAKWHAECFICHECGQGFANSLFFPKDGQALCTSCWDPKL